MENGGDRRWTARARDLRYPGYLGMCDGPGTGYSWSSLGCCARPVPLRGMMPRDTRDLLRVSPMPWTAIRDGSGHGI